MTERSDFVPDPDFSSLGVGEVSVSPVHKTEDEVDEFPDAGGDIDSLLTLGALSVEARIYGHVFEIHTLRAGEELIRDQIVNEYEGMLGQARALGLATAAAAVKRIDGTPLQRPLGPSKSEMISAVRANFDTMGNYFTPVIERIYDEYEKLEVRQARAFRALEGK